MRFLRRGAGKRTHQRIERPARQFTVAGQVFREQFGIDAGIDVVDARAVTGLANKARAGIVRRRLQIVDGGVVIVLNLHLVGGDGMGDLHGGIAVVIGTSGQHAPEHGDIDRTIGLQEQELRQFLLLWRGLPGERLFS